MKYRAKQMVIFLSLFSLILGALHFYLYQRTAYYLQLDFFAKTLCATILASLMVITIVAMPLSRALPGVFAKIISWIVYPWMGLGLLLITGFLIADLLWLSLNIIALNSSFILATQLQKNFGLTVLFFAVSAAIYAMWNGLRFIKTKNVEIRLKKLPAKLDGLRIVQITDIHIGPILGGDWLQRVVDRVNALEADIVAITGDLVDGSVAELGAHVLPLQNLRAKHGVFFVTGNHEYYSGADEWCDFLRNLNITVLRNDLVSLKINDETIDIAGVEDWSSRHFLGGYNLQKTVAARNINNALILLSHQPRTMHDSAKHQVDLQISGHTHAGQIWPFNYLVYLQQPVSHGLFQYSNSGNSADSANSNLQLYVNSGTGFWGPPMRLGTFAEITVLRLRSV